MKTFATKYAAPRSGRLNHSHAHRQTARLTKLFFLLLAAAVGLSVLLNLQELSRNQQSQNKLKHPGEALVKENHLLISPPAITEIAADKTIEAPAALHNEAVSARANASKKAAANLVKPADGNPFNAAEDNSFKTPENKSLIAALENDKKAAQEKAATARRLNAIKANETYLKANDLRNLDILNELSQVTSMHEYHFKKSSSQLDENTDMSKLDSALAQLRDNPESWKKIVILGFTDNRGSKVNNVKLGMKRADNLKALLVSKGISEERITVASMGPELPVATNKTAEGRERNRRVELNVVANAVQ